jgi:hypothetical protein
MLDLEYPSLRAFQMDCEACELDASALLASGEYVLLPDGRVVASSCL